MNRLTSELCLPQETADELEGFLSARFPILVEDELTTKVTLFDTFDWRLYRSGTLLRVTPSRRGSLCSWCDLDGSLRHEVWEPSAPGLLTNLHDGTLRLELRSIVSMRRLLPLVDIRYRVQPIRLLDDEEKTLVRLFCHRGEVCIEPSLEPVSDDRNDLPMPTTLGLQGLRGYDKAFHKLERSLLEDFGCEPCTQSLLHRALEAGGARRYPGDYTSKPQLELDPAAPAVDASRQIYRHLLEVMQRNEAGLRRDDDSEFLHDFRVAVRRTRSALSQIKKVLPPASLAHFRKEFSWLGSLTGPTRDLDVFLLKMDDYRKLLPPKVAEDLDPLTRFLENKQRREHRTLVRGLDSDRYRRLVTDWTTFLDGLTADDDEAPNAGRPIVGLATQRIWRLYRRVIKDGRHILQVAADAAAHAEALHDLRIECKKLRYSLEFFRSLYPKPKIDPLIRALKKLQDNLGDFNDFEVQRYELARFADEMMGHKGAKAATFLAMGRLMTFLAEAQEKERLGFEVRFLTFMESRHLFEKLFAPSK